MSAFKKEVKAILKDWDVRDPRGALNAIEVLCDAEITGPKKPERILRIDILTGPADNTFVSVIKHRKGDHLVTAKELSVADSAIRKFACEQATEIITNAVNQEQANV